MDISKIVNQIHDLNPKNQSDVDLYEWSDYKHGKESFENAFSELKDKVNDNIPVSLFYFKISNIHGDYDSVVKNTIRTVKEGCNRVLFRLERERYNTPKRPEVLKLCALYAGKDDVKKMDSDVNKISEDLRAIDKINFVYCGSEGSLDELKNWGDSVLVDRCEEIFEKEGF